MSVFISSLPSQSYSLKMILFISFSLLWVFVAVRGLSLLAGSGGSSSLRCAGFSPRWLLLLWSAGSRHEGFSSCSMQAQELWRTGLVALCMWSLPRPGTEPVSPALAGRFLSTVPPRKSFTAILLIAVCTILLYLPPILYCAELFFLWLNIYIASILCSYM